MTKQVEPDPASAAKAARMHEQIDRLTGKTQEPPRSEASGEGAAGPSPRSFVQRRMRELDQKK